MENPIHIKKTNMWRRAYIRSATSEPKKGIHLALVLVCQGEACLYASLVMNLVLSQPHGSRFGSLLAQTDSICSCSKRQNAAEGSKVKSIIMVFHDFFVLGAEIDRHDAM